MTAHVKRGDPSDGSQKKKAEEKEEKGATPEGPSPKEEFLTGDQKEKSTEEEVVSELSTGAKETKLTTSFLLGKKLFWIGLPVVFLIGALAGGVFIYKEGIKKTEKAEEQLVAVSPSSTPTPPPTPIPLNREDLKLQVLNGRGVAGTAAEAKEFLEGLGYEEIEIDNADSYDYEETEVSIKEDKKDYLEQLSGDLSEKYTLSVQTPYVDKESEFDAIITIGRR